ncbi:extracellular solute-binding protein [Microlunatus soli]|uniref:Putative aldouronate transport system substrate-binding protein n=1 Tax=Microlunatus soli TaxID=630515 RepID=A0A1H1Y6T5_9ACTN|nr:extracellular solute-binding protein [Microlunatus soli]SDT17095.1 putative aldouronate transport system substrate-binding protein [Microlunatus soli]
MSIFTKPRVTRRSLLAATGGAALLAGSGSLSGCGASKTAENNTAAKNEAVKLPSYIPYTAIKPDLPGTKEGVDNAFRTWPTDNPKSVPEKPGTGKESLSAMADIYYAVPPGPDKNSYWAGLNERMGIDLKIQMVGNADYSQKFATTIAGSELPDVLRMLEVANFPSLLDKRFTPLDEHLAGDAIKEYPNLANIPTRTWKSAIYNGKIYGIPIPRGAIGSYNFIRQDLFDAKGLPSDPKGYDEFIKVTKELTDPKKRRWAFSLINQPRQVLGRMNGEPNGWRYENDKLTNTYETEEYKQTVTDLIAMWKSGVIHPDAFDTAQPFKQLFNAGTCAINAHDGYPGWIQYILDNESTPGFKLGLMPVYNRDGSELAHWDFGSGVYSFTALKKQDSPDKIKTILRMLNYLAAPFGTEEYLYRLYGKEGVDHTMKDGNPVLTKTGTANTVIPVRYLADAPYTIYVPGRPQDADTQHKYQSLEIPTGISNPTVGLFSNAKASKNATIDKNFNDGINQVIQGRKPLSELDSLLSAWKSGGGDEMRKEYQDQLQKNGGPS